MAYLRAMRHRDPCIFTIYSSTEVVESEPGSNCEKHEIPLLGFRADRLRPDAARRARRPERMFHAQGSITIFVTSSFLSRQILYISGA